MSTKLLTFQDEYLKVGIKLTDADSEFWRRMMSRLDYQEKTNVQLHSRKFKRFVNTIPNAISDELSGLNLRKELELSVLNVISERGDEAYKSTIYQGLIKDKKMESERRKKGIGLNFGYERSFNPN